jgi:hypothetical protein
MPIVLVSLNASGCGRPSSRTLFSLNMFKCKIVSCSINFCMCKCKQIRSLHQAQLMRTKHRNHSQITSKHKTANSTRNKHLVGVVELYMHRTNTTVHRASSGLKSLSSRNLMQTADSVLRHCSSTPMLHTSQQQRLLMPKSLSTSCYKEASPFPFRIWVWTLYPGLADSWRRWMVIG